jgi:ABC-type Fe3+ transport system permease subunit
LLILAWICLAVSVAAGLLTLFGDVRARTHAIKMMIETQGVGAGAPGCVFAISYFLTAASFLVALAAFVAFAIRNTAF